jgi:hypothetical protein
VISRAAATKIRKKMNQNVAGPLVIRKIFFLIVPN